MYIYMKLMCGPQTFVFVEDCSGIHCCANSGGD